MKRFILIAMLMTLAAQATEVNQKPVQIVDPDTGYHLAINSDGSINIMDGGGGGSGTVTSVDVSVPSWLTSAGGPITSSGTIAITGTSQSQNLFLASPNGSSGAMTPRSIVAADIPTLNQNTSGSAASFSGSLLGDITGTQGATVASFVGGSSAASINAAELLANAATATNTASTIMKRDASGQVGASTITVPAIGVTAAVGTDKTGTNLVVAAGNGTGTGGSGQIKFQTAPAGSTGATPNTLSDRMIVTPQGVSIAGKGNAPSTALSSTRNFLIKGEAGSTNTELDLIMENSSAYVGLAVYSTGNQFLIQNGTVQFFSAHLSSTNMTFGYGGTANRFPLTMSQGSNSTNPALVVAGGSSVLPPVFATHNSTSTAGNYGCFLNAGSSAVSNGWLCFYNDTHTNGAEDSHVGIATAAAGTKTEKMKIGNTGQIEYGGSDPAVSLCGTSPSVVGSDSAGRITVGTGGSATSCTLTFAKTWANAPICMFRNEVTGESLIGAPSTTSVALTRIGGGAYGASDTIAYHCLGYF